VKESVRAYSFEKSLVKRALRDAHFYDIKISNGYYYFSGFATKDDQIIYFSIPDIRHSNPSHADFLIRTAKDYKDFTGGGNNFCLLDSETIQELANRLTK
jgi:hypothetical protein